MRINKQKMERCNMPKAYQTGRHENHLTPFEPTALPASPGPSALLPGIGILLLYDSGIPIPDILTCSQ